MICALCGNKYSKRLGIAHLLQRRASWVNRISTGRLISPSIHSKLKMHNWPALGICLRSFPSPFFNLIVVNKAQRKFFRKINARNASKQDIYELIEISWKIWNNPSKKTICIGKPARHNPGTVKIQAIADLGRTDVPADHGSDDQTISILFRLRPTKREGNTRLT